MPRVPEAEVRREATVHLATSGAPRARGQGDCPVGEARDEPAGCADRGSGVGLVTMCAAGGMAPAIIIERIGGWGMIVERKLRRNPQTRCEVVGHILDYACALQVVGERGAIYTIIETCKLDGVDPQTYSVDIIA